MSSQGILDFGWNSSEKQIWAVSDIDAFIDEQQSYLNQVLADDFAEFEWMHGKSFREVADSELEDIPEGLVTDVKAVEWKGEISLQHLGDDESFSYILNRTNIDDIDPAKDIAEDFIGIRRESFYEPSLSDKELEDVPLELLSDIEEIDKAESDYELERKRIIEEEERLRAERAIAEEERWKKKELALMQKNLGLLGADIVASKEKETLIQNWLDTRVINIVSEDSQELKPGDAGKVVCTFNKVTKEFSLVFGANKCKTLPTKFDELGKYFASDAWKTSVWYHEDIKLQEDKYDILYAWGWAYIVLEENKMLIAGRSRKYFGMSERVVGLGLHKSGYTLVTSPSESNFSEFFIDVFYNEAW